MPLSDQTRILHNRLSPRIVTLWQALAPLKSVVSFMNTGAHPDDETSAMLAALGFRDGLDLSYACSTRGEGGQNDIGTEASAALGVLRTAEMERAAEVLNLRLYWHCDSPGDTIHDFGFSKSGVETAERWGPDRLMQRFVHIVRSERPDIICPTFLDIPGQHGHHRAMTEAAHRVMDLAADPGFAGSELPPWQVSKLYLPAWSGAGQSYDDDLPPPPATLTISADGTDPVTGWSYEQIGQQSRAFHKTQAMGRWMPAGSERNWALHLADSRVDGPDTAITSGLPRTLSDIGQAEAQRHVDAAIDAFPDAEAITRHASAALKALEGAGDGHRIARKRSQLARLIRIASGVEVLARTARDHLGPSDIVGFEVETRPGRAEDLTVAPLLPDHWQAKGDQLLTKNAPVSDPYPSVFLPGQPAPPCLRVSIRTHGVRSETCVPFEVTPIVLPARAVALSPGTDVVNLATARRDLAVKITTPHGTPSLTLPEGWQVEDSDDGVKLSLPDTPATGQYTLPIEIDGDRAHQVQRIAYDHVAPRALSQPAALALRVVDVALPDVRVGYVGAGNDRVDHWLQRLGMSVTALSDADLESDAVLGQFDTILIGIFALKFRPALGQAMARLHRWCADGGTLVTLYHRPWDNWEPSETPPHRLEIGQPSLRWRVTDAEAEVTHLLPDHPCLTTPNRIGAADWEGWHKERGLYFAKSWDPAYRALLSMADPGEAAQEGALLVADVGKGRHVHCALILHHQMEKLVPGAFALMANLLARRA